MIALFLAYWGIYTTSNVKPLRTPNITSQVATVTAYSSYETCNNCITASGVKPFVGIIACPRSIPFHTQVIILGQVFFCEDRTALKYDGRYDIFMGYGKEAYNRAIQFGKKRIKVLN